MAAEQRTETSSNANNITYSEANIDTLLASFEAGDIITKAAVDILLDYYADITDHTHTVVDLINSKTFGNTGGSSETTDTVDAASLTATPTDPGTNSTVTASKHNEIRNAVNSLRGHVHNWEDN